jgi:hypothetical protein
MPTITRLAEFSARGTLVKPLLHQFVMDPTADVPLNLLVRRPMPRKPDGRFHASQHPLMSDFELYLWMTGQRAAGDDFDESSFNVRMAVMFGSLAHAVIEAFLAWTGRAVPLPEGSCASCGRPYRALRARPDPVKYCTEFGFAHPETRSSAHLDAILDFGDGLTGFDFKSIYPMGLKGVRDMDTAQFREKWPKYWAQGQECMRVSGLRRYIFLFMTMGSPWETREFHLTFDHEFAAETDAKYRRVLYHLDNGIPMVA